MNDIKKWIQNNPNNFSYIITFVFFFIVGQAVNSLIIQNTYDGCFDELLLTKTKGNKSVNYYSIECRGMNRKNNGPKMIYLLTTLKYFNFPISLFYSNSTQVDSSAENISPIIYTENSTVKEVSKNISFWGTIINSLIFTVLFWSITRKILKKYFPELISSS